MTNENGTVTVGVDRPDYYNQCWFTDGYFDYVPHFIDGMAAMPELAPADTDHMLRSTSVVQEISYQPHEIAYRTYDSEGTQRLRLTFRPCQVLADGRPLAEHRTGSEKPGWDFDSSLNVLTVRPGSREVIVAGRRSQTQRRLGEEADIAQVQNRFSTPLLRSNSQ
jgi:hypothetical protein